MSAATAPATPQSAAKPASRGLVIAAAIFSALGSSALALGVQYYSALWATERTERVGDVNKVVDASQQFDASVTKFMGPFLAGANDAAERKAVRDNVQLQYNLLETAKTYLSERQAQRATDYQTKLVRVGEELDRKEPAVTAQALIQAIADARAANVCVVFDLRQRAGLPVIESDRAPCEADLAGNRNSAG